MLKLRKLSILSLYTLLFLGAGCSTLDQQAQLQPSSPNTVTVNQSVTSTPPIDQNQQVQEQSPQPPQAQEQTAPETAPNGTYQNTYGNEVPRPYAAPSRPEGASAQCRDGTYSFSQHRSGTCSHHGGVSEWY